MPGLRGPGVFEASMKLGVFTPVFGTLTLDEVLVKVRSLEHVQALELGTGGWPGQRSHRPLRASRQEALPG